jgi:hypothetical protein
MLGAREYYRCRQCGSDYTEQPAAADDTSTKERVTTMLDTQYLMDRTEVREKLVDAAEQFDDPMAPLIGRSLRDALEELDAFREIGLTAEEITAALALAVRRSDALDEAKWRVKDVLVEHHEGRSVLSGTSYELITEVETRLAAGGLEDPDNLLENQG